MSATPNFAAPPRVTPKPGMTHSLFDAPGTAMPLRLVLDTNVVLDLFHFRAPAVAPLAAALTAGRIRCLTDTGCLAELRRVLAYPKLKIPPGEAERLWHAYAAQAEQVPGSGTTTHLPRCRDRDDQRFLELAARGRAAWLVSKDKLVLKVRRSRMPLPFTLLHPDEAILRLATPATAHPADRSACP